MGGACTTNEGDEECILDIGGEARRKRLLGRSRCRWVNDIKIDLRVIGGDGMDWINLAQDMD
jgi:hypothetical protein